MVEVAPNDVEEDATHIPHIGECSHTPYLLSRHSMTSQWLEDMVSHDETLCFLQLSFKSTQRKFQRLAK